MHNHVWRPERDDIVPGQGQNPQVISSVWFPPCCIVQCSGFSKMVGSSSFRQERSLLWLTSSPHVAEQDIHSLHVSQTIRCRSICINLVKKPEVMNSLQMFYLHHTLALDMTWSLFCWPIRFRRAVFHQKEASHISESFPEKNLRKSLYNCSTSARCSKCHLDLEKT